MSSTWNHAEESVRKVRWDFAGTVVLITGAAQGQGRSHALTFAKAGADLVICDLPVDTHLAGVPYELGDRAKLDEGGRSLSRRRRSRAGADVRRPRL